MSNLPPLPAAELFSSLDSAQWATGAKDEATSNYLLDLDFQEGCFLRAC